MRPTTLLLVLAILVDPVAAEPPDRSGAQAEDAQRWWIALPRAGGPSSESADHPYPPAPTERALARRAARGRPERVAELTRGPSAASLRLVAETGARIRRVSRWLSAVSVEADPAVRARLTRVFGEDSIHPVRSGRVDRAIDARPTGMGLGRRVGEVFDYGPSWNQLAQIGVDRLHDAGLTGRGVVVLVLDTGFRLTHPALVGADVWATYDFINGDPDTANDPGEPTTQDRHGTGVLGVIVGQSPGVLIGAAPDVSVLLAKTEDVATETRVEEDNFVAALEWGEALGADMMTASLGYRFFNDEPDGFVYDASDLDGDTAVTTRAVDDLVAMGVVALSSAGNRGPEPETLLTPADADSGLAIGAVDSSGVVAWFSSRGPSADGRFKPDLAALGVDVHWADTVNGAGVASGTSLSTPLVAGAAALILQAHPDWGPGEVAAALRATSSRSTLPDNELGWGVVDAHAAVFDWRAPEHPLPFALLAPDEGADFDTRQITFAWEAAVDLQTPDALDYRIELALDRGFSQIAAVYEVGSTLSRSSYLTVDGELWWRVVATDPGGLARVSEERSLRVTAATGVRSAGIGDAVRWQGPWPNPTSGSSTARLVLQQAVRIETVEVHDVAGRRVRRLEGGIEALPGERLFVWDGRDGVGRTTASGVYFLRSVVRDAAGARRVASLRMTRIR